MSEKTSDETKQQQWHTTTLIVLYIYIYVCVCVFWTPFCVRFPLKEAAAAAAATTTTTTTRNKCLLCAKPLILKVTRT